MDDDTIVTRQTDPAVPPPNPWRRWLLPALLGLLIVLILGGAYIGSHPHLFGGGATATPTVTPTTVPTATPKPRATATAKPLPTATAVKAPAATPTTPPTAKPTTAPAATPTTASKPTATPHPTGTPRPTSTPAATATPTGVQTGQFSTTQAQLSKIQQGASQGNAADTPYLDPFKAVQTQLGAYRFTGTITVVQPPSPPAATPTTYAGAAGAPSIKFIVEYQGKRYSIVLNQPVQQGAKGIWILFRIVAL